MPFATCASLSAALRSVARRAKVRGVILGRRPAGNAQMLSALLILAVLAVLVSLLVPMMAAGIGDPHELRVAEYGRRIAVALWGDDSLRLAAAPNTIPVQRELGRGELPFTSVGLGFRAFGLHPWAGRLPLALWAFLGLAASAGLAHRLGGPGAAVSTVLVLATTPLYFLHARVMVGYGVAMAGCAMALWGLVELCWPTYRVSLTRSGMAAAAACVGLLAGALSQGVLLGVAVPMLGVGLTFLWSRGGARQPGILGFGVLALGAAAALWGGSAIYLGIGADYSAVAGMTMSAAPAGATHQTLWRVLGHSLFPWSGPAVIAFPVLLAEPPGGSSERAEGPPVALLLSAVVLLAICVHGAVAPYAGATGFVATAPLAVAIGIAFCKMDHWRRASPVLGMVLVAATVVIGLDLVQELERTLVALSVGIENVPATFHPVGKRWIAVTVVLFCGTMYFGLLEPSRSRLRPFVRDEYLRWPRILKDLGRGDALLGLAVVEMALMILAVAKATSDKVTHWSMFEQAPAWAGALMRTAWVILPMAVLALPVAFLTMRDVFRWLFSHPGDAAGSVPRFLRACIPGRGTGVAVLGALVAQLLSVGYYPALMRQGSPARAFDRYRALASASEPLGLFGTSEEVAPYVVGRDVPAFYTAEEALDWLLAGGRRWLVLHATELASLNAAFRDRAALRRNLPVLDARSSQVLLASSMLEAGDRNSNPLDAVVLSARPQPANRVSAMLGDELEVLGWELRDHSGRLVDSVVTGRPYELRLFFCVRDIPRRDWSVFVHVDGHGRRHNADHELLGGHYPIEHWRVGDCLVDAHELTMEHNFSPGEYHLYFGLYQGTRRLPVTTGTHHENRIDGGRWLVR